MNSSDNKNGFKLNQLVNWGTIWGVIFAIVSFNLYSNYKQETSSKQTYHAQLQQQNREIDSLRTVKAQLNKALLETKSALDQCQTVQASQMSNNQSTMASRATAN